MLPRRFTQFLLSTLALAIALLAFVTQAAPPQIGGLSTARYPARSLSMRANHSRGFLARVGGVALTKRLAVAGGTQPLQLKYDAGAADGMRLQVLIREGSGTPRWTVAQGLYDWELVPLARFTLEGNDAAVTLFGELDEDQSSPPAGYYVVNYHPELDNTLIGLRLLQADMLLLYPDAADLFRDPDSGEYVLGAGESEIWTDLSAAKALENWGNVNSVVSERVDGGEKFTSYVVGDLSSNVSLTLHDGQISFAGLPTWHMWVASDAYEMRVSQFADRMSRDRMQLSDRAFRSKYSKKRVAGAVRVADREVVLLPGLTRDVSDVIESHGGINPVVYRALTNAVRYTSLYRSVKKRDPKKFSSFVRALPVNPSAEESRDGWPFVETPTLLPRPSPM